MSHVNNYTVVASRGKSTQQLMILVMDKLSKHMKAAKQFLINHEPVELGKHIFASVKILNGLSKTITVRDDIENSEAIFKMYETLTFQIENLIAKKSQVDEYDYYINYFDNLKKLWEQYDVRTEEYADSEVVAVSAVSSAAKLQEERETISHFTKAGRFEIVT